MTIKIQSIIHLSSNQFNRSIIRNSSHSHLPSITYPTSLQPADRSRRLISSHRSISTNSPSPSNDPSMSSSQPRPATKIYGVTYVPPLKLTRQHTKGGDYGLYDGLKIRAGDNVSKSKHRTKRVWKPNVQKSKLWSEVLGQSLQLRVTTAALKTIDKMGGLDRYVLQMSDQRLGAMGIRIRGLVIAAMKERVKLSKAFTQPIPAEQAWRIPQWQDSIERVDRTIARKMVPSLDVHQVTVFPRVLDPTKPLLDHPQIQNDFLVRGQRGSQTSRRSTHPRR